MAWPPPKCTPPVMQHIHDILSRAERDSALNPGRKSSPKSNRSPAMNVFLEKYFHHPHQRVLGIMGGYTALYFLVKSMRSSKPAAPGAAPSASSSPSSSGDSKYGFETPTLETLDKWASNESNVKAWEAWLSKPDSLNEWAEQYEK